MALDAGNLLQLSPLISPMTEEKPDYEPSKEEIEALKQVVEESREGLSKLAVDNVAENQVRKKGSRRSKTTEISV